MTDSRRITVSPAPSEEEVAAILAAVEVSWPRAASAEHDAGPSRLAVLGPVVVEARAGAAHPALVSGTRPW